MKVADMGYRYELYRRARLLGGPVEAAKAEMRVTSYVRFESAKTVALELLRVDPHAPLWILQYSVLGTGGSFRVPGSELRVWSAPYFQLPWWRRAWLTVWE